MAITSRTAAARVDHAHQSQHEMFADGDPLFQFLDFTFSDENGGPIIDISSPSNGNIPVLPFDDFPSPVPLNEIISNKQTATSCAALVPNNVKTDRHPAATSSTVRKPKTNISKREKKVSKGKNIKAITAPPKTTRTYKPEDVLSVRGVGHSKNPGNMKFRELVNSKKSAYERNTDAAFRRSLGEEIVSQLKPGRFLKKADAGQYFFQIMDHDAAVTKAMFAVRDVKLKKKKAPSSNVVHGKRKRKQKAAEISVDNTVMSRTRPKRKTSAANPAKSFLQTPQPLTSSEEGEIEEFICDSILFQESRKEKFVPTGTLRSEQIFKRIEGLVEKGAAARRSMDPKMVDQTWFDLGRQKDIRLEVSIPEKGLMMNEVS